ncbi:MAG: VOC family protein [Tildeniella nuda ZEHNDER 1965/U140]|nr:VOC family protein [Tildeniella nuda ZEHNDER 1965/U140]
MKIRLNSVFVDDQEKAVKFYTEILGFVKKVDLLTGDYRWLTVVSPEEPDGTELLLEPNQNPVARTYQVEIFEQGIPATAFAVENVQTEYDRPLHKGFLPIGEVYAHERVARCYSKISV